MPSKRENSRRRVPSRAPLQSLHCRAARLSDDDWTYPQCSRPFAQPPGLAYNVQSTSTPSLARTLDPLPPRPPTHLIILILARRPLRPRSLPRRIHILKLVILSHGVGRRRRSLLAWRENGFETALLLFGEGGAVGAVEAVGEFHVEADVEVAVVVVAIGGHALFADHFYGACLEGGGLVAGSDRAILVREKVKTKGGHTGCNDLAGDDLDVEPALVQMLHVHDTAGQSSQ